MSDPVLKSDVTSGVNPGSTDTLQMAAGTFPFDAFSFDPETVSLRRFMLNDNWALELLHGVLYFSDRGSIVGDNVNNEHIGNNFYYDSANWKYRVTDEACILAFTDDGTFRFYDAPSGTAGGTISFVERMTLAGAQLHLYARTTTGDNTFLHIDNANSGSADISISGFLDSDQCIVSLGANGYTSAGTLMKYESGGSACVLALYGSTYSGYGKFAVFTVGNSGSFVERMSFSQPGVLTITSTFASADSTNTCIVCYSDKHPFIKLDPVGTYGEAWGMFTGGGANNDNYWALYAYSDNTVPFVVAKRGTWANFTFHAKDTAASQYGFLGAVNNIHLCHNVYYDGNWRFMTTGVAMMAQTVKDFPASGDWGWLVTTCVSGTAGNTIGTTRTFAITNTVASATTWGFHVDGTRVASWGASQVSLMFLSTASAANVRTTSGGAGMGAIQYSTSSLRFKSDLVYLAKEALDIALALRPVSFKSTIEVDDRTVIRYGFVAEEVDEAGFYGLVDYDKEGLPAGVQYPHVTAIAIGAIQDHEARIRALEEKIA